jgi:hypothetical protein
MAGATGGYLLGLPAGRAAHRPGRAAGPRPARVASPAAVPRRPARDLRGRRPVAGRRRRPVAGAGARRRLSSRSSSAGWSRPCSPGLLLPAAWRLVRRASAERPPRPPPPLRPAPGSAVGPRHRSQQPAHLPRAGQAGSAVTTRGPSAVVRIVSSLFTPGALGFQAKTCDSTYGRGARRVAQGLPRGVARRAALVVQRPLVRGEAGGDVRRPAARGTPRRRPARPAGGAVDGGVDLQDAVERRRSGRPARARLRDDTRPGAAPPATSMAGVRHDGPPVGERGGAARSAEVAARRQEIHHGSLRRRVAQRRAPSAAAASHSVSVGASTASSALHGQR